MVVHYIVEENIFVIIAYKLLKQKYDCFKSNGKHMIKMSKKGKYVTFKNYKRKIKWPFRF